MLLLLPSLPREFLNKLLHEPWMKDRKSLIFSKEFHAIRLQFADQNQTTFSAESIRAGFNGGFFRVMDSDAHKRVATPTRRSSAAYTLSGVDLYEGYSLIHVAIDETDPPFACELIRYGIPLDQKNGRGQTPLLHALERLWDLLRVIYKISKIPKPSSQEMGYKAEAEHAMARIHYILRILIAQHVDVNSIGTWQGGKVVSSLHFACAMSDWDLIALLLEHGAKSKPTPACIDAEDFLIEAADKRRFRGLKANLNVSRPLRLCPCFSGKPIIDCHSQRLPYPADFICSCGSAKAYGNCCKGRNIQLVEDWHEETQTIQMLRSVDMPYGFLASPELQTIIDEVKDDKAKILKGKIMKLAAELLFSPDYRAVHDECMEIGFRENIADPAFRFAYFETKYLPSPSGRTSSKHFDRKKQKDWNAAVDKYIATGTDTRQRFDIEATAKIGISLGPLHRSCEGDGCDKVEGRDIEKISTCSHCKMTFYCGPTCQRVHWPKHKSICGTREQAERPLPSQIAIVNFVAKYGPALMVHRMGYQSLEKLLQIYQQ